AQLVFDEASIRGEHEPLEVVVARGIAGAGGTRARAVPARSVARARVRPSAVRRHRVRGLRRKVGIGRGRDFAPRRVVSRGIVSPPIVASPHGRCGTAGLLPPEGCDRRGGAGPRETRGDGVFGERRLQAAPQPARIEPTTEHHERCEFEDARGAWSAHRPDANTKPSERPEVACPSIRSTPFDDRKTATGGKFAVLRTTPIARSLVPGSTPERPGSVTNTGARACGSARPQVLFSTIFDLAV